MSGLTIRHPDIQHVRTSSSCSSTGYGDDVSLQRLTDSASQQARSGRIRLIHRVSGNDKVYSIEYTGLLLFASILLPRSAA